MDSATVLRRHRADLLHEYVRHCSESAARFVVSAVDRHVDAMVAKRDRSRGWLLAALGGTVILWVTSGSAPVPAVAGPSGLPADGVASLLQAVVPAKPDVVVQPVPRAEPLKGLDVVASLKRVFAEEGVPVELVWVAEVESALQPEARSRAGAVGLYQLMPVTAQRFGLSVGPDDERLDALKNARAAARYLAVLYRRFGSWPLALAAFNAGESRTADVLRGQPRTFDAISQYLPRETRSYVPRVLALVSDREGVDACRLPAPGR